MNGNYISIQPKYEVYKIKMLEICLISIQPVCLECAWRLKYEYNLYHMLLYNLFNKI